MTTPVILAIEPVEVTMIVVIVVLLGLLMFFAAAEISLARMTRSRASTLEESNQRRGRALVELVRHPEQFLNSLLLVVLVLQSIQTALTTIVTERLFGGIGVAVGLFFNIVLVFVLTEAAPKTWAVQHTDRAALMSAWPVRGITRFWPLKMLSRALIGLTNVILPGKGLKQGPFVSEDELRAMADEAADADVIEVEERALINRIIDFGDTIVREVMVPRTDMIAVDASLRAVDAMEVVLMNGYSRIPVMEAQNIDDIIGIAYAKDLMRAERDGKDRVEVRELVRGARPVPETKRVAELLPEMQVAKFHMAIVIDEHGGTAGLVTLEDLIEELVGEIVDEFDMEDQRVEPLPGGNVRVNGSIPIDDANDVLPEPLPEGEWDTVAGLVLSELGQLAKAGDTVEVPGYEIRVDKVQGRRISRVSINRVERPPEEGAAGEDGEQAPWPGRSEARADQTADADAG